MFNLQRELDSEVELLEEKLAGVREEAKKMRSQGEKNEQQRRAVITEAEAQLSRAREVAESTKRKLGSAQEELKAVRDQVAEVAEVRDPSR